MVTLQVDKPFPHLLEAVDVLAQQACPSPSLSSRLPLPSGAAVTLKEMAPHGVHKVLKSDQCTPTQNNRRGWLLRVTACHRSKFGAHTRS